MQALRFEAVELGQDAARLRAEVRAFLVEQVAAGALDARGDFVSGFSAAFSGALAARGWIGMTWPKRYGGAERSALERYVVIEELLAVGAPVAAHWIADRQSGPLLLRFGTEEQRQTFLPPVTRGTCFFCIGMSEPDSGSDLASVRTRADPVAGGFAITGRKVWTSNAHRSHFMVALARTGAAGEDRRGGLSQFIVDLTSPGLTIRPILNLAGRHEFNEVTFDAVFVPEARVVGKIGDGWKQVTSELAHERSGPERFLSVMHLLALAVAAAGRAPDARVRVAIGRLVAHLWTLRRMSLSVAGMLHSGSVPELEATIVKDLGNLFEQEAPEHLRLVVDPDAPGASAYRQALEDVILDAPSYSLRGGTREILRGIIARGLGLR
ncbi:MAG: acyl-CoA dehydrogenase [Alphaproteobacteria bacterium]|nr:acyl-CoA dehydrogenase [Alphaproteobacteria bacterium]